MTGFVNTATAQVPSGVLSGTFTTAPSGFLSITENFATTTSGVMKARNPPLTGAWAVEIPGAGALGNLLSLQIAGSSTATSAAPVAMAENTSCPNFSAATPFLYVTVPNTTLTTDTADYGTVSIATQGSAVTLSAQPYLIGATAVTPAVSTGGCSVTSYGPLTAYPLNFFGTASNLELITIAQSGLLLSSFTAGSSGSSTGAFGGGTGIIGVAAPSAALDVGAVTSAHYNGLIFAPLENLHESYDATVLASSFGDNTAASPACSALESSLAANNGQGAKTIAALPSANSVYGGEFLTMTTGGAANDPSGAAGSENCDTVIDLGTQDPANNGLFPDATIFIGSNYPPFSTAGPWNCFGTTFTCAVSFPAVAVVGTVQGQFVIFAVASSASSPAAQLPDTTGSPIAQPIGIYLFQRSQ